MGGGQRARKQASKRAGERAASCHDFHTNTRGIRPHNTPHGVPKTKTRGLPPGSDIANFLEPHFQNASQSEFGVQSLFSKCAPRMESYQKTCTSATWYSRKRVSSMNLFGNKVGNETGDSWSTTIEPSCSQEDFLKKSKECRVPWRDQAKIPDRTLKVIVDTLTWGSESTNKYWDDWMNHILKRAVDLKDAEEEKRKSVPECVAKINKGKRTLLTKELLNRFQYPDIDVADCMREDFL